MIHKAAAQTLTLQSFLDFALFLIDITLSAFEALSVNIFLAQTGVSANHSYANLSQVPSRNLMRNNAPLERCISALRPVWACCDGRFTAPDDFILKLPKVMSQQLKRKGDDKSKSVQKEAKSAAPAMSEEVCSWLFP